MGDPRKMTLAGREEECETGGDGGQGKTEGRVRENKRDTRGKKGHLGQRRSDSPLFMISRAGRPTAGCYTWKCSTVIQ